MHMSVEESIQVRLSKCSHEELNLRFSRSLVRKLVSISVLLNESPRDFRKADLLITLIT